MLVVMAPRLTDRERLDRAVSERDLMNNFMDAARLLNWKVMHVSDSRRMTRVGGQLSLVGDIECKGWPDLFMVHPGTGRRLAVEVKRELGKVTPEQQEWLTALEACGIPSLVLRPSGWDEAIAMLRRPSADRVLVA